MLNGILLSFCNAYVKLDRGKLKTGHNMRIQKYT